MQFQVARLHDIVNKIKLYSKLNFKNAIDVNMVLMVDELELEDINKLISAGIQRVGFNKWQQYEEIQYLLLPCKKHFYGDLEENFEEIMVNFDVIESLKTLDEAKKINHWSVISGKVKDIFVQINVVNENDEYGVKPSEFNDFVWDLAKFSGLRIKGISAFVPNTGNSRLSKTILRKAGVLFKLLHSRFKGIDFFSVNQGLEIADLVADGVNLVRIGVKSLTN
ncbi:hypothetical protein IT411_00590 [Candidatus Peregrinibacteria bacterium]|nr:hypothetical protein [Candidatus Peregrinibacteria bacterium]